MAIKFQAPSRGKSKPRPLGVVVYYGQTSGDFGTCSLPGKRLGFLATKLICKHALDGGTVVGPMDASGNVLAYRLDRKAKKEMLDFVAKNFKI